jgi:transposase InsO family protein
MQALLATPTHTPDPNWYSDTGATHHLTSELANLNVCADEYHGPDQIRVGNGTSLPIKHIGSTQLSTPTASFLLNNVLHVPQISKNLISVRKFTKDTNTSMDFRPSCFRVQALDSRKTLLCGPSKDGLYPFPLLPSKDSIPPTALFGERTSIHQWHSRLGHPAFRVVAQIISKFGIPVTSNKSNFSCSACLSSKSKQLPFSLSRTQIQSPLELIYSDVWGNSPVCSRNGNRYYISFLDAYSRYTWLFPMSHKNDALPIFIKFQKYVERYFNLQIKSIQLDWGGEYRSLSNFFANCGITHRVSCPHTHQQNGAVERKHRHIVETGLALLSHANIPLRFWDDAFQTACYLINLLPQLLLKNISPFEKLFHTMPEYNFLKTFGCACWPNLRPYNSHKLQPCSTQCVFLGYSISHKGYKCFHIPTGRTYISRDVIFLETQFPFQKTQNPISSSSTSILGPPVGLLQSHSFTHGPHNRVSSQNRPLTGSSSQIQPIQPTSAQTQQPLPTPAQTPSLNTIHDSPSSLPDNLSTTHPENSSAPSPENSSTTHPEISNIPANPPPPPPTHPMKTRSHHQIFKPKSYTDGTIRYPIPKALLAETTPESDLPEPTCYTSASKNPDWRRAMNIEFDALLKNHTWQLVPSSPSQNIIGCKWVFRIKRHADGSIERFKARLVAKGFHQQPGLDYGETYSPVIKPTTVRAILSIAISAGWAIRQIDIQNAFLHGHLSEDVFMAQPLGISTHPIPLMSASLKRSSMALNKPHELGFHDLVLGFFNLAFMVLYLIHLCLFTSPRALLCLFSYMWMTSLLLALIQLKLMNYYCNFNLILLSKTWGNYIIFWVLK